MPESIPLFTPAEIVENKLDELNTRMELVFHTFKEKNAPLDSWGVPMVWNRTTRQYDISPFDASGNYR
jgi:hypothetical protein